MQFWPGHIVAEWVCYKEYAYFVNLEKSVYKNQYLAIQTQSRSTCSECAECGFMFMNPMIDPESIAAFYRNYAGAASSTRKADKKIRRAQGRMRRYNITVKKRYYNHKTDLKILAQKAP